jgi:hypothetical protein
MEWPLSNGSVCHSMFLRGLFWGHCSQASCWQIVLNLVSLWILSLLTVDLNMLENCGVVSLFLRLRGTYTQSNFWAFPRCVSFSLSVTHWISMLRCWRRNIANCNILEIHTIDIVTDLINALPGNGCINTPRYTHATIERGYAVRF